MRDAAVVGLLSAAMGGAAGAILGAFLGWLAGPIFRGIVTDMDAQSFGAHRRPKRDSGEGR